MGRLRDWIRIDWDGFGRTKGGFFDFLGMPMDPTPPDPRTTIIASGGWCAPARQTGHTVDRHGFTKWRSWYPPLPPFELPRFSAPRGPIEWPRPKEDT